MANQILIRNLSKKTLGGLKARAANNKRSLQAELKQILVSAAPPTPNFDPKLLARIARSRESLKGRIHGNSANLIREGRRR